MTPLRGISTRPMLLGLDVLASMWSLLVCLAFHLVHADALPLHLQDTNGLRMLSRPLHARCTQCCGFTFKFNRCPVSKPIVAPQLGLDSPHRGCRTSSPPCRCASNVSISPDPEFAPSSPPTTSSLPLPRMLRPSAAAALLLLTLPASRERASSFVLDVACSISFAHAGRSVPLRPWHVPPRAKFMQERLSSLTLLPPMCVPCVAMTHFNLPSNSTD